MKDFLKLPLAEKEMLRQLNQREFADYYDDLKWFTDKHADSLMQERQHLWGQLLSLQSKPDYNNTKVVVQTFRPVADCVPKVFGLAFL